MDAEELNRLAAEAMQRVTEWVHRSAGQHSRAVWVNYLRACDRLNGRAA